MSEQLNKGRRLARRYMAVAVFAFIYIFGFAAVFALLFSDARMQVANALEVAAMPLTMMVIGPMVMILLAYLGISGAEQVASTIWRRDSQ